MENNRWSSLWWGACVLAAPAFASAQASGESSEMGPGVSQQSGALDAVPGRSALWQAVEATHRQRGDGAAAQDRRLSAEQRQQLREQIRRASMPSGAEPSPRGAHVGER